ncbi:MAG TPA: MFS transporter, partial [Polyangiaceae bacterium]|nr:MFS transporter [Polyangiaceae bacterium]
FMCTAFFGASLINVKHPALLPSVIAVTLWVLVLVSRALPKTTSLPPRPVLSDAWELLTQARYRQLLTTMLLIFTASSAYDLCVTMFLTQRGANGAYVGKFWAVAVLAEVAVMSLLAPAVQRLGPGRVLVLSCAVAAGRWLFIANTSSLPWLLALQPLHAVSFGLMWIAAISMLRHELGDKGTATAHGLFSSAIAVGNALGLLAWSVMFEKQGGLVVFTWAGMLAALGALSAVRLIRPNPAPFEPEIAQGQTQEV